MVETKNDGVIQVTLLASELTEIIEALIEKAAAMEELFAPLRSKQLYALAGRLDDIR